MREAIGVVRLSARELEAGWNHPWRARELLDGRQEIRLRHVLGAVEGARWCARRSSGERLPGSPPFGPVQSRGMARPTRRARGAGGPRSPRPAELAELIRQAVARSSRLRRRPPAAVELPEVGSIEAPGNEAHRVRFCEPGAEGTKALSESNVPRPK